MIRADFILPASGKRHRRFAIRGGVRRTRIIITSHTPGRVVIDVFGSGSKGD